MANDAVILTEDGLKEKQEKLEYLKTVKRAQISEQIKEARAFGDLSENAEYDEAKNEQARVETEIPNWKSCFETQQYWRRWIPTR
jgi:transcription elongation factor GreA